MNIPGGAGHELAAVLERPEPAVRGTLLLAHAFGSSKDLRGPVRVARALAGHGWASLRFDFTGLGQSGGRFADTDLSTNIADLQAAAAWLAGAGTPARIVLGHSFGGVASLLAAPGLPDAAGFVTLGMPSTTGQLRDRLLGFAPQLATEVTEVELEVAGKRVTIGRRLLEDLPRHDLGNAAGTLGRPLLILHSPIDRTVPVEHAARVFRRAHHPKSFIALEGADHLVLENERDAAYVAALVAAFADRFAG